MNHIEAMKQAAVYFCNMVRTWKLRDETEPAQLLFKLRQAIEAAEKQEPTYYLSNDGHLMTPSRAKFLGFPSDCMTALFSIPPTAQREWVGLTDEEIIDVIHPLVVADLSDEQTDYEIAKAIEAKLKEKNS